MSEVGNPARGAAVARAARRQGEDVVCTAMSVVCVAAEDKFAEIQIMQPHTRGRKEPQRERSICPTASSTLPTHARVRLSTINWVADSQEQRLKELGRSREMTGGI